MSTLLSSWIALPLVLSWIHAQSDDISLPASCVGQEDGYQWLKPLDGDEYPAIRQKCDNEYMMINLDYDPNVQDYFSSYTTWHYALSGPKQMDPANWEDWWLPNAQWIESQGTQEPADAEDTPYNAADNYFSYIISPECHSCTLENNIENNLYYWSNDDTYGDRTGYYMTGTIFGCLAKHKAMKDCRWDYETYSCNYCTEKGTDLDLGYHVVKPRNVDDFVMWNTRFNDMDTDNRTYKDLQIGICGVYPQSTYNDRVPRTRDDCNDFEDNIKPSIGNNGRHCVCVKPQKSFDGDTAYSVSEENMVELETLRREYRDEEKMLKDADPGSIEDVYELWQKDFTDGTYRIQKAGTYVIMEDIEFNFNAGDGDDPNSGESWWPKEDQSDLYPGAGSTRDVYYLGFIAGITVEVDNVRIDLNDHEIAMSLAFYYQQRFFSCIALKSVAFPLNQGPGNFGMEPKYANNVEIKNGKIGLSSHHGIHGHFNSNVTIENVHVHSFETHGIQMSYFKDLTIQNVEIGPSSTVAYLKGEYAYARWTLMAFDRIRETDYNVDLFPIQFANRPQAVSLDDVVETLRDLMDIAFKSVMGIEEYDDDDVDYQKARDLFINNDGTPYGAVMYGLFLNLYFSNVFTIHPSTKHSKDALIDNVTIHGLHHKTVEYLRMDKHGQAMFRNQFNAPLDARAVLGSQADAGQDMVWSEVEYVGSPLTDAEILLSLVTDDWGERGLLLITSNFSDWAFGRKKWDDDSDDGHPWLGCNNDRMAHVPKGVIGVRMDGVERVSFRDLTIHNVHELSAMGSNSCGEYWDEEWLQFHGNGNPLQNAPYLYGYTGNRAHGIFSDWADFSLEGKVKIHDVTCSTGLVRGIGLYTSSKLHFKNADLEIHDLAAGTALVDVDTDALKWPYNPSIAKPLHIIWSEEMEDFDRVFKSKVVGEVDATMYCVVGRDGTDDSDFGATEIANEGCYADGEGTFEAYQRMIHSESALSMGDLFGDSVSDPSVDYERQLVWSLSTLVALVIIGGMVYLWEKKVSVSIKKRQRAPSECKGYSESQPLIGQHLDALRYL